MAPFASSSALLDGDPRFAELVTNHHMHVAFCMLADKLDKIFWVGHVAPYLSSTTDFVSCTFVKALQQQGSKEI